jgi:flagellar export protein FliJ
MSKYQFRLETLRRLRIAHRDQQRSSLADAYRAEQILVERRVELANEQSQLRDVQRAAMSGRYIDVNQLVAAQRYEAVLAANEQQLANQTQQVADEIERRRLVLVEADRAVRVLDLLDERHRQEYRRQAQRIEVKRLDEVAMTQRRPKRN